MKKFILGFFIIIFAIFLRVYNLTILPVFADEAIYIRWAQVMRAETTLRFLPMSDGKQPLFMWVMIPFFKIFSNPLFAGRMVSVLTGIGTLIGIYILSYLLFRSKKAAFAGSFIYAILPFTVFFDRMALVDSMLSMFGVWTFIFTILTIKFVRLDTAMLAGFALGGALLTKSPALFFTLLLPTTLLFIKVPKNNIKKILQFSKALGLLFVTLIIGYALFNILRLGPNFHLLNSRNQDYIYPISHLWENPRDPFIFHFDRAIEWLSIFGVNLLLPFAALSVIGNYRKYFKQILFLLIISFSPIVIQSEFAKVFTARYILFTVPYFVILAGSSFIIFKNNLQKYYLIIFGLFIILALRFDYKLLTNPEAASLPRSERSGYLEEWTAGTGIAESAKYFRDEYNRNPNQKIVIGTEGYFGTLPDGLQIYLNDIPEITVIGVGLGISEIPKSLRESRDFGNKTYLVINSSRLKMDKDFSEYGYKVIASYKKADRPYAIKEYIQHGPFDMFYLLEVLQ